MGKLKERLQRIREEQLWEGGSVNIADHPAGPIRITVKRDHVLVECPTVGAFVMVPLTHKSAEDHFNNLMDQAETLVQGPLMLDIQPTSETRH